MKKGKWKVDSSLGRNKKGQHRHRLQYCKRREDGTLGAPRNIVAGYGACVLRTLQAQAEFFNERDVKPCDAKCFADAPNPEAAMKAASRPKTR